MPRLSLYPSPSPHRHTDASRILKAQFSFLWPAVIDVGESAANDGKVPPPTTIAAFREKVKTLHFSNGADKPVVAGLYEKMLRAALGGSKELIFMKAGWGDAEAVAFAESLPLCTRLERLDLEGNNEIGNEGLTALARALADGAAPKLEKLELNGNDFSGADEGLRLLGQAKHPALEKLQLSNGSFNLAALAEGMQEGSWPSLEELWMINNKQASDEGAEALARALERGAMPKLKKIIAAWHHEHEDVGGGQGRRRQGAAGRRGEDRMNLIGLQPSGPGDMQRRWKTLWAIVCVVLRA